MNAVARIMHALGTSSPHATARRWCASIVRAAELRRRHRADLVHATYWPTEQRSRLRCYWPAVNLPLAAADRMALRETCGHYLAHRFDLLGSGWVRVRHGMRCRGLSSVRFESHAPASADTAGLWLGERINAANLESSRGIWRLVDHGYVPIDWHLDFKSGYRWSESTWYRDIRFGDLRGADVKVPWELARMQHLPRLACAHALAARGEPGFEPPAVYAREFRNQVLDFMATNPPRYGVNWHSTMDVGIRVANWLVAYDWLRVAGATWDRAFDEQFVGSIEAHGRHIRENLDWDPAWRGNHYLANVVGLLFVAAYLPPSAVTDGWLAFAVEQLIAEVCGQFAPDGSNIEASTSYHRLSAEMVAYGTALALALPADRRGKSPFPAWYFERLERMAEFTLHATKTPYQIHQVGDNDNGHFLNLAPPYLQLTTSDAKARFANLADYDELPDAAHYWAEDHLDHRPLVAIFAGLVNRADFIAFCGPGRIETELARQWVGRSGLRPAPRVSGPPLSCEAGIGTEAQWRRLYSRLASAGDMCRYTWTFNVDDGRIINDLESHAYPNFGLFIWRSRWLYLAVRCGPARHKGVGAHAHNDQLAIELALDGRDLMTDPGTGVYTPDPQQRDRYRSVRAHCSPRPIDGREPGRLDLSLFALGRAPKACCLYFGPRGFAGVHHGFGRPVYRIVELDGKSIVVTDFADRRLPLDERWSEPLASDRTRVPFSAGYGIIIKRDLSPGALSDVRVLSDVRKNEPFVPNTHGWQTKSPVGLPSAGLRETTL